MLLKCSVQGQMYNPTPWQAINDCNSANPGKCWFGIPDLPSNCTGHCRSNVGKNDFYSNFTVIPSKFGGKPSIPKEMLDEWLLPEWRTKTWGFPPAGWGLHPWNAPGSAPVWGNGCGVNGGNPYGCNGGDQSISKILIFKCMIP